MNSIVINEIGKSSVLKYSQTTIKELNSGELLVKVTATAVNYIDTLIRSGQMPPSMMPELPFIPGVECIGVIEGVSDAISDFKIGDKVAYFGEIGASTYSEFVIARKESLIKISSNLDDVKAAIIPVNYSTAYHMLHNLAKISSDDVVLVHAAAGGVGTAILQLAKIVGATIIGAVGSDEKKNYILNEGADFAINYKTENLNEEVLRITKNRGVDVSFNPVAGKTMISDLDILAPFGHLIVFGFITGLPDIKLQEAMIHHFGKSLTVSYSDIYTLHKNDHSKLKSILSIVFSYLEKNKIAPRVFQSLKLKEASKAHLLLESGKVVGKLILIP